MPEVPKWRWLETSEYGGQDGSVLTKLFKGKENLTAEALLAREAIQNSWDAARAQMTTHATDYFKVIFRFVELTGRAKSEFVRASGLQELQQRKSLVFAGSGLDNVEALITLKDPQAPLRLLYVEDFGTHGLFGDPEKLKSKSHLFKAMYLVGGTDKADVGAAQGGSYGFGKGAFVRASRMHSVIAYSAFGALDDDHVTRRLVGWTWWPGHTDGERDYEGRSILGNNLKGHVHPFFDVEADDLASALGMGLRNPADLRERGATFLLIDPSVRAQELCHAIEVHWWPALEEHLIDVSVVDTDGSELIPRPSRVSWLAPYLEAFRIASGNSPIVDQSAQKRPSDRWRALRGEGVSPGELGLVASQAEMPDDLVGPRVALIRSPRMVIEYKSFLRRTMPIYGAFVASRDADPYLRLTEPPAHDLWETKERSDTPADATRVAKSVLDRVRKAVMDYAQEFQPPSPGEGQRLHLMTRTLSSFVSGNSAPQPSSEPVSIQFVKPENVVVAGEGLIQIEASIRIEIQEDFGGAGVHVSIACPVVISEDHSGRGERWGSHLSLKTRGVDFELMEDGSWCGFLPNGAAVDFDLQTDAFDADWTAIVYPRAQAIKVVEVGE